MCFILGTKLIHAQKIREEKITNEILILLFKKKTHAYNKLKLHILVIKGTS